MLEEVLRQHAASLPGVTLSFNTELVSLTQHDDGVTADVKDIVSGQTRRIESRYAIGADGARSAVRDAIGAKMVGEGAFSRNTSVIFRCPGLASRHAHGPAIMYWMVNDDVPSLLGPMDQEGLWFFMATKLPDNVDAANLDAVDLIRHGTGLHDLAIEIVGTDLWVAHRLVADSYAQGRVFLAGDACHLHPPFGGFGMNMGIGDAVDLGWKLAATIQGWGGEGLLASYQAERRPVHERTIGEAVANYGAVGNQLVRPSLEDTGLLGEATRREVGEIIQATKVREFKTLGLVLGARYADSPIVVSDGSAPPAEQVMLYVPSAHPGCLAPHLWLADGSSLYDHFGNGFTLLITRGTTDEADHLAGIAVERNIPLKILAPADDRLRARYETRFALIRPDQHVAWRGDQIPVDVNGLLDTVIGVGCADDSAKVYTAA